MKILVDMNLSPLWAGFLVESGFEALHWSTLGDHHADDGELLAWCRTQHAVLFTHDLDFSALIALAGTKGPSVIQIRTQDLLPEDVGEMLVGVLREHEKQLLHGAIVSIVEDGARVRVLPITIKPG